MNPVLYWMKRAAVWVIRHTGGIQISLGMRCRECNTSYAFQTDITDLVSDSVRFRRSVSRNDKAEATPCAGECRDCVGEGACDAKNHLN